MKQDGKQFLQKRYPPQVRTEPSILHQETHFTLLLQSVQHILSICASRYSERDVRKTDHAYNRSCYKDTTRRST